MFLRAVCFECFRCIHILFALACSSFLAICMLSGFEVQLENCRLKRQSFSARSAKPHISKNDWGFVREFFPSLLRSDGLEIARRLCVSLLPDGRVAFYLAWPHLIRWLWRHCGVPNWNGSVPLAPHWTLNLPLLHSLHWTFHHP